METNCQLHGARGALGQAGKADQVTRPVDAQGESLRKWFNALLDEAVAADVQARERGALRQRRAERLHSLRK